MKLLKRTSVVLAAAMVLTGSLSCIYAAETEGSSAEAASYSDDDYDNDAPTIEKVWTDTKDGKTYLNIQLKDGTGVKDVRVDDKDAEYVSGDKTEPTYAYEITEGAEYTITAIDENANTRTVTQKVEFDKEAAEEEKAETQEKQDTDGTDKEVENIETPQAATTSQVVKFMVDSRDWTKNGEAQEAMEVAPMLNEGRVYLPVRYTASALGVDDSNIKWDAQANTVTITDGSNTIKLTAGSKTMRVNAESVVMDAEPIYKNGRVYLPVSQVGKAFEGVTADWDGINKIVTITKTAPVTEDVMNK